MASDVSATIDQTNSASFANVLDILAWEIELAGARCLKLDNLIGEMLADMRPEQSSTLAHSMHLVDLLTQHLTGLSAFSRAMSCEPQANVEAPFGKAVATITLGALADRLCGALGGSERGINDCAESGDLDLF